jgi:hypothetical protein
MCLTSFDLQGTPSIRLECQPVSWSHVCIGELGKEAGLSAKTIRYYEDIGVIPEPHRTSSGYRDYGEGALDRLRFIKAAQAVGFSLGEIRKALHSGIVVRLLACTSPS